MLTPTTYRTLWPVLASAVLAELPPEIASRLKTGRQPVRHGTYGHHIGQIWDRRQNDLLPKAHFLYCVVLNNPARGSATTGYFHAWFNLTRIYRDRAAIVHRLTADLRKIPFPGYNVDLHERALSIGQDFNWPASPENTLARLVPAISTLIARVHPVIAPVIDSLALHTERDDAARPAAAGALGPRNQSDVRSSSRAVPATWHQEILATQKHHCVTCGGDLRALGHHIDHIVPFSRGGTSHRENLQALCPPCNLAKGNR